jgi:hypothetical protein
MDAVIGLLWLLAVTGFVWAPFAVMIFLDHYVFERRMRGYNAAEELPPLQPRLPEEQPTQPKPKELQ